MKMAANSTTEKTASTSAARKITTYDLVIGILAIFSLIILIPLIFGKLPPSDAAVLNTLEDVLCIVFLFDFFRSFRLAPEKWPYFLKGGGWLDLLGSVPISAFAIFRVARLFRVVRLLRKLTGDQLRHIITRRLAQSTLLFTLVVALLLVITISWGVLLAEQHAPHANILSYHEAVWWAFVTITTVGYGNYHPVTPVGQFLAVILMFFGLGIIGVLSSYLATTFISLQRSRSKRRDGENENDEEDDHDDSTSRDTELAAIREELAALRNLFEERYHAQ
jgi:voltage-gated potassium channel